MKPHGLKHLVSEPCPCCDGTEVTRAVARRADRAAVAEGLRDVLPTGNPRAAGLMECPECGHSVCWYSAHDEYRCDNQMDCAWRSDKAPPRGEP